MKNLRPPLLASLLLCALASHGRAATFYQKLSTGTRLELDGLSSDDRARLGRELSGEEPKSSGNDLLCSRWGCVGGTVALGGASWHASPDGSFGSNSGLFAGFEAAAPVPGLQDHGVGAQLSASYGVYDLTGRTPVFPFATENLSAVQRQELYSLGLFRRPDPSGAAWHSRVGLGLAYDFSFNQNASEWATYYQLRQWRYKASYLLDGTHEIGLWGAMHSGAATRVDLVSGNVALSVLYRPVDQLNLFYKHNLAGGGSLSVYAGPGVGSHTPIAANGTAYAGTQWTLGAGAALPVSDHWGVFADLAYATPHLEGARGIAASCVYVSLAQAGLRFFWGGNARVRDDSGRRWMPYVPAPNNGSFVAQSSQSF
jgi:hypothetical protein